MGQPNHDSLVFDQYHVEAQIGEGEIATVYRAWDTGQQRSVAVKVLRPDATVADSWTLFTNEAVVLASVNHRHIPRYIDFHRGDAAYIVMEVIDGKDLQRMLDETVDPFPVRDVIRWGIQLCDVLTYLHSLRPQRIIFRDLKPAHIMIDRRRQVRLVDFNLALPIPADTITYDAPKVGTEGYAPPEQYHGVAAPQSDIYALGATLHYLVTRRDPRRVERFSVSGFPASTLNPDVPATLETVLTRATAYRPADRFESAAEMQALLMAAWRQVR